MKVLSPITYQNLQAYPVCPLFILGIALLFIFQSWIFPILIAGLYMLWLNGLYQLKTSFKLKVISLRFVDMFLFDLDHIKCSIGTIVTNKSETYSMEITEEDEIELEVVELTKRINVLKTERERILAVEDYLNTAKAYTEQEQVQSKLIEKKITQLEKSKKNNQKNIEKLNKEIQNLKENDKNLDNNKKKIKKLNKELKNLKWFEKTLKEDKKLIQDLRLNQKAGNKNQNQDKLDKKIDQMDDQKEKIEAKIKDLKKKLGEIKDLVKVRSKIISKMKIDKDVYDNWKFYRCRNINSNLYNSKKNPEVVFILPTEFENAFSFSENLANFGEVSLQVPNHTAGVFLETSQYRGIPYLLCFFCSFDVKEFNLKKIRRDLAKALDINSKLATYADEQSTIQWDYQTLQHDNRNLQRGIKTYKLQLLKEVKRKQEGINLNQKLTKFSIKHPGKEYNLALYLPWVVVILFFILFILK